MISNLRDVFEGINNIYSNITYTLNEERSSDDRIYFSTVIESQFFKGSATVTGIVEKSGYMNVIFTYGQIEDSKKAYDLINDFNKFAAFGKAYIGTLNGKKYLEVRYSNALEISDVQAVSLYRHFFDDMLSENLVDHVTPMVALTK